MVIHIYEFWTEFEREVTYLSELNNDYIFRLGYGRRSQCFFAKFSDNFNTHVYCAECLTDLLPYINLVTQLRPIDLTQVIETMYNHSNSNSLSP